MPTEADLLKLKRVKDVAVKVEKPIAKVEVKPIEYVPVKVDSPCPVCGKALGNGEQITVVDGCGCFFSVVVLLKTLESKNNNARFYIYSAQEYHTKCFVCATCQSSFGAHYWPHNGKPVRFICFSCFFLLLFFAL